MNILQVLPKLNIGGVERGVADFSSYLVMQGHKSVVVSSGGELVKEIEKGGIHYQLDVDKKSIFSVIRSVRLLTHILVKENIEILHARSRVPGWIGYFATRKLPTNFITTAHGYYSVHFLSRVMSYGKFVICPSQVIARHMIEDFDCPSFKIRVIPRSVNLEKFKFHPYDSKSREKFIIVYIGRLTRIKGLEFLIKALKKVTRSFSFVECWIVGSSKSKEYEEELKTLVRRFSLQNYIRFLGSRWDIPEILKKAHLLVLPSICEEAFGRVIIEAQATGVPVVATNVGGIKEIIEDNITGIIVPPKNVDSLSSAIIKIIKEPSLAKSLVENAYKKVSKFYTLENMCSKTLEVYKEALNVKRILVIKISSLGDLILILPSLKAIKEQIKNSQLILLTHKDFLPLLKRCSYIDEVITCSRDKIRKIGYILKLSEKLRVYSFDISIDFQNTKYSHLLSFLGGVPIRIGFKRKWGFFLNRGIPLPSYPTDPLNMQARLLQSLNVKLTEFKPSLGVSSYEVQHAKNIIRKYTHTPFNKILGINLGGSPRWKTKSWRCEFLVDLINYLNRKGIVVILTGLPFHQKLGSFLEKKAKKLINLCGKTTLSELVSIIYLIGGYLTVDSAPLHISLALGKNTFAVFGPTLPDKHLPKANNLWIFRKENLNCLGCYKRKCKKMECMDIDYKEIGSFIVKKLNESSTDIITS